MLMELVHILTQPDSTLLFANESKSFAFLLLFSLCGLNSYIITGLEGSYSRNPVRLITFTIATVLQMISVTVVLGILGILNYHTIIICLLFIFILSISLKTIIGRNIELRNDRLTIPTPFLSSPLEMAFALIVFAIAGYTLVWAVISPPPASDSFIYHLTLSTKWMQTGTIFPADADPFGKSFHPANPEAIYLWSILPFHNDSMTNLVSWFFWLMCAVAVYTLARVFNAGHGKSIAASLLWMLLPLSSQTATSSEVDLFAAFFVLSSCIFFMLHNKSGRSVALRWGGLSIGIYLGSKFSAIFFAIPIFALYFWSIRANSRRKLHGFTIFLVSVMAPSFIWYLLNYLLTGNPIYPFSISLFGRVIAAGMVTRGNILSSADHARGFFELLLVMKKVFGAYLAVLLLSTLPFAAVANGFDKKNIPRAALILMPFIFILIFQFGIGTNKENSARFLFPAAALACVGWSAFEPGGKIVRLLFYAMAALCAVDAALTGFTFRTIIPQLTLCLFGESPFKENIPVVIMIFAGVFISGSVLFAAILSKPPVSIFATLLAVLLAFSFFTYGYPRFAGFYETHRSQWYRSTTPGLGDAWLVLDYICKEPCNIGVIGTNLYHGFHGAHLRNTVQNMNTTSGGWEDKQEFIDHVRQLGIDHLVINFWDRTTVRYGYDGGKQIPVFLIVNNHPDIFTKQYSNRYTVIYNVRKGLEPRK
jgi:hypothetical protein